MRLLFPGDAPLYDEVAALGVSLPYASLTTSAK
jgi:hypothetical protein